MTASGFSVRTADGLALAAERHPGGEAVVLVHGLGFARGRWQPQVEALQRAGFGVITYDLRGFGHSDRPAGPYGVAVLVDDLERVRAAAELESFYLVGHSLGGMLAQRYALDHPGRVRSLALISTTSHSGARASAWGRCMTRLSLEGYERAMADPAFAAQVEAVVRALASAADAAAILATIRDLTAVPDPARAYGWEATVGFSTRDELSRLAAPVLVMHGSHDLVIPYVVGQLILRALPNARWLGFARAGHNLPTERAADVAAALCEFLPAATRKDR